MAEPLPQHWTPADGRPVDGIHPGRFVKSRQIARPMRLGIFLSEKAQSTTWRC